MHRNRTMGHENVTEIPRNILYAVSHQCRVRVKTARHKTDHDTDLLRAQVYAIEKNHSYRVARKSRAISVRP